MWRLTDEAIREGVKSTTRYRSKQPNKRGHRTQQPQPQRQASGAKGGQAARRSARMKRSGQYRSNDQYISRSVPAAFDPSYHSGGDPTSMPYPPSPYYGSDVDFGYASKHDDFGSPGMASHLDLFSPARSYSGSPMSQHGGASVTGSMMGGGSNFGGGGIPITDQAYVLDQSPTDSLFANSPSPSDASCDQPRTPVDAGGWPEVVGMPCVFEEQLGYREYAG
jgi:hypothetical protein